MAFVKSWSEATPGGTDVIKNGDNEIRNFKYAIRERLAVDHRFYESESGETQIGGHDQITLVEQASDASPPSDAIMLYAKNADSYADAYLRHENAGIQRITYLGKLWIGALGVSGATQGDMITRGATAFDRLAIGTTSYIMKSSGTAPIWDVLSGAILQKNGAFKTTLSVTNPTANRTITVPDEDVTLGAYDFTAVAETTNNADVSSSDETWDDVNNLTATFTSVGGLYIAICTGLMDNNIDGSFSDLCIRDNSNNIISRRLDRSSGPHGFNLVAVGIAPAGSFTVKVALKTEPNGGVQNTATLKGTIIPTSFKVFYQ